MKARCQRLAQILGVALLLLAFGESAVALDDNNENGNPVDSGSTGNGFFGEGTSNDTGNSPAAAPVKTGPSLPVVAFNFCQDGAVHSDAPKDLPAQQRAVCGQPFTQCPDNPDGSPGIFGVVLVGATPTSNPVDDFSFRDQRCFNPAESAGAARFRGVTQADFRRLTLTPETPIIQPPNGRTLINKRTNVYSQPNAQTLNTTILGFSVLIRATPAQYQWDFGDGGTLVTTDPGAAYPNLRTTHTYTRTGDYSIQLTTIYTGQYSLDGGRTWFGIEGTASATSPAIPITAMHIHTELITGDQ